MKFSMNMLLWSTHIQQEHFYLFDELKSMGFDAVEIPVFEGDFNHYKEMAKVIKDSGLECTAVSAMPESADASSADESVRSNAEQHLMWIVDMVEALGSKRIVGPLYSAHGKFEVGIDLDLARNRSAKVMKKVAQYAANKDISIALEFLNRFEIQLLNCSEDTANYIKQIDEDNVGILYDFHHANIEEKESGLAFHQHGHLFNHLHFSESHRGILGEGQVQWEKNVLAMKEIGYDDWIAIEAFAHDVPVFSALAHVWRPLFPNKLDLCKKSLAFSRKILKNI